MSDDKYGVTSDTGGVPVRCTICAKKAATIEEMADAIDCLAAERDHAIDTVNGLLELLAAAPSEKTCPNPACDNGLICSFCTLPNQNCTNCHDCPDCTAAPSEEPT